MSCRSVHVARVLSMTALAATFAGACVRPTPELPPPPAPAPAAPAPPQPASVPSRAAPPVQAESAAPRPSRARWMTCGDERVVVHHDGADVRLIVGGVTHVMSPVPAASGAKYEAAGDPSTSFWSKGMVATLEIAGRAYPECTMQAADEIVALGHEPGWRLDIAGGTLTLVTDYGSNRVSVPTPYAEAFEGGRRYIASSAGRTITATVLDRVCVDAATGMPKPLTVRVEFAGQTLNGCGGDTLALLRGAPWTVQTIGGTPVARGTRATLVFGDDGRLSGSASCNSYSAAYTLTGEGISLGPAVATRKACRPAVMKQEAAFLAALGDVQRLEVTGDGVLVLHTAAGPGITSKRE